MIPDPYAIWHLPSVIVRDTKKIIFNDLKLVIFAVPVTQK